MNYIFFDIETMPEIHLLGNTICKKDWKLAARTIQDYEFIIVYHGQVVFLIENIKYILSPGDFILLPPGKTHRATADINSPGRFYYAHFTIQGKSGNVTDEEMQNQIKKFMAEALHKNKDKLYFVLPQSRFKRIYLPMYIHLKKYQNTIYSLFEKALSERNHLTLSSEAMISLYISQIFYMVTRCVFDQVQFNTLISKDGKMPRILQEVIFYIHEHNTEPLEIKSLCDKFMITPQYLIRLFKKYMGITPIQYIHQLKITKAKNLIRKTSMTIKEIAFSTGINNPYYFSKLFKKIEGIPPSEYKKIFDSKSNG